MAESIFKWFRESENKVLLNKLFKYIHISGEGKTSTNKKFEGKTFVLTGTLSSLTRDEAKEEIRVRGGEMSSSVSKNVSYVVAGDSPGSKFEKAQDLEVQILTEQEFLKLISS